VQQYSALKVLFGVKTAMSILYRVVMNPAFAIKRTCGNHASATSRGDKLNIHDVLPGRSKNNGRNISGCVTLYNAQADEYMYTR